MSIKNISGNDNDDDDNDNDDDDDDDETISITVPDDNEQLNKIASQLTDIHNRVKELNSNNLKVSTLAAAKDAMHVLSQAVNNIF